MDGVNITYQCFLTQKITPQTYHPDFTVVINPIHFWLRTYQTMSYHYNWVYRNACHVNVRLDNNVS